MIGSVSFYAKHQADIDILVLAEGYDRALRSIGAPPLTWQLADAADRRKQQGSGGHEAVRSYLAQNERRHGHVLHFDMNHHRQLRFDGLGIENTGYRSHAWFIDSYGVNLPVNDSWNLAPTFIAWHQRGIQWQEVFQFHTEHRIALPRLFFFALSGAVDFE